MTGSRPKSMENNTSTLSTMNALKQYIDLFKGNRKMIEAGAPAVLNDRRQAAYDALVDARLPRKGSEDYEATDLEAVFAPDYGLNISRIAFSGDAAESFRCDVPNMSTCLYMCFNDSIVAGPNAVRNAGGVIVETFKDAAVNHPEVLAKHYGTVASLADPTVALNTMLAQDGLLVYVPRGVMGERPIQLVNIFNTTQPLMAVRRILVVLEQGAQARLLVCDHTQSKDVKHLSSQVVEVVAGEDSSFDYYDLEESSSATSRVSTVAVRQEAGSNVLVDGITLTNGFTRNDYYVDVNGRHAETTLLGMTIASGEQHVDTHSLINHNAPQCHSNEMIKYVLDDKAVGAFAGKILVKEGCPQVEAYQGNRNLCASPAARIYTKPQLEIYTDDVKASHGTTIGQLDQDALFYMQARGISAPEARRLLMQAFMADVVDGVRLEVLRDRLHHLVEKRFNGTLAACASCGEGCGIKG